MSWPSGQFIADCLYFITAIRLCVYDPSTYGLVLLLKTNVI